MKINKLNIRFVIAKNKIRKDGKAPLFCRLTFLEQRKQFATGFFIIPKQWNSTEQVLKPPNEENTFVNTQLSLIKQKINQAFLFLQVQEKDFEVEDIYLQYIGEPIKEDKTILKLFQEHNNKMEKLIGKDYSIGTLWKFKQSFELLKGFIKFQFKKNDYLFKNLDLQFVQDYEFYLKTEKNLALATTNKAIQRFRKIIKIAISQGILDKDPFIDYKVKHIKKTDCLSYC